MKGLLVVALLVASCFAAPQTPANAAWNVNFQTGTNPANYFGQWPGHTYFPSPADWRGESVYQFITDRFSDGNPDNNDGVYGGYDVGQIGTRHGGDFKGITSRLDYIKSLGYTAIWISPMFQNQENSYHGYAQIDFTVLDDRFGTLEEFREFVNASHARGLKVIVDIVVNHMADLLYFEGYQNGGAPFRFHTGEYRLFYRGSRTYTDFVVDNTYTNGIINEPVYKDDGFPAYDSGGGSFWSSDFHHNGDLGNYGDVWQNHLGKIYGIMDDLRTTHPRVQDKLIAMTKALISSTDVDGIRMDTPMQVPLRFFQRWAPAVRAHAASLGKSNFFIYGEFYCTKQRATTMTGRGKTPAMYGNPNGWISPNERTHDSGIHYPLYWWFINTVQNQNNDLNGLKRLYDGDYYDYDFYEPAPNQWRYKHLHFYNNHDQWRMSASADGFFKTDMSSAIIAFWPGIPLFYAGDEQGLLTYGTALDGWSREDMMTSVAWKSLPTVNGANPADKDNFDYTNPHYLWVQKIMNVRKNYWVLSYCDQVYERWTQSGNTNGIYIFSRVCGQPNDYVMVAFNTWKFPLTAGGSSGTLFTGWGSGDVIVNVLNPSETYTLGANGVLPSLSLNGYQVKVFVRSAGVKALNPVITWVTPSHDSVVNCDYYYLAAQFSEPMNEASVLAATRFNGAACSSTTYRASDRVVICQVNTVPDGINKLTIAETATSVAGKSLMGTFVTRFKKGTSFNPIATPNTVVDPNFVTSVVDQGSSWLFNLALRAPGASKFRLVSDKGTPWTAWQTYTTTASYTVPKGAWSSIKLTAQYWADGSTAYWTDSTISLPFSAAPANLGTRSGIPCQGNNPNIVPQSAEIGVGNPEQGAPSIPNLEGARVIITLAGDYSRIGETSENKTIENPGSAFNQSLIDFFAGQSKAEIVGITGAPASQVEIIQIRSGSIIVDSLIREPSSVDYAKKLVKELKSRIANNGTFNGLQVLSVDEEFSASSLVVFSFTLILFAFFLAL